MILKSSPAFVRRTAGALLPGFFLLAACSLPPTRQISREEFERLKLASFFDFENSPEDILGALNRNGEVIFEGIAKNRARQAHHIRIFATEGGPEVNIFPVE